MDTTPILFVPILAGTWMFGLALFSFISHLFLTIVEETGNGVDRPVSLEYRSFKSFANDGFNWTEDPFGDWLFKFAYIAIVGGVWFGPSVLLGRYFSEDPLGRTVISSALFWLGFPFGICSSLASSSRWIPLWPPLLRLMFFRPIPTLLFYLFSLPMMAIWGFTFYQLFVNTPSLGYRWAIAISPLATLSMFMYARLLGRFAYVMNCARGALYREPDPEPEPERKPHKRKPKEASKVDPMTQWSNPTAEHDQHPVNAQPEDLPPIVTPDEGAVTGYNIDHLSPVARPEPPKPRRVVHRFEGEEDDSPFAVKPEDNVPVPTPARSALRTLLEEPSEREIALYTRRRPVEPTFAYGPDLISQMLNARTFSAALMMSFGIAIMAVLVRLLAFLRPNL